MSFKRTMFLFAVMAVGCWAFLASADEQVAPAAAAADATPRGCVDCHRNNAEKGTDLRFSTLIKQWAAQVSAGLLAKSQGAAPAGMTLKGKHPNVTAMIKALPDSCMSCHKAGSKMAPAFSQLMHVIHLAGGKDNKFASDYAGQCVSCHKLNEKTGAWRMASGTEDK